MESPRAGPGSGRGSLPLEATSYVPRSELMAHARDLLGGARLVTMVGAGGTGKTRLANRVATQLQPGFSGGAWFVDLAVVLDGHLLLDTICDAVRLTPEPGHSALDSLIRHFAADPVLLVLDNCEHVLDDCAAVAAALVAGCSGLRILATSRESLGVVGEARLPVTAMPVPARAGDPVGSITDFESVALFVERARQAYPGFQVTAARLAIIGEICFRLDGLPLAIELAAVRLRALSVEQLLARLSDPYRLLTGGSRTAPERQRTLWASIAWSHDLCSPAEQAVWARLSIFVGGCELDAAEAVCSGGSVAPEQVLDVLQSLVEKSLLIATDRSGSVWFSQLETIREFGYQQLVEAGDVPALELAHGDWYRQLMIRADADWVGPRQRYWLARMYREIANLRAALERSLSDRPGPDGGAGFDGGERTLALLGPAWRICWWTLARVDELLGWIDRALAQSVGPSLPRARVQLVRAFLLAGRGEAGAGALDLAEGAALAAEHDDRAALALAASAEAVDAESRGDLPSAVLSFERGLALLADGADPTRHLNLLARLAVACDAAGDDERSRRYQDEVLRISGAHGELFERSYLLLVLGVSAWIKDDAPLGRELVGECLRLKRELGDLVGSAMALQTLGCIAAGADDRTRAAILLGAADQLWDVAAAVPASFPEFQGFRADALRAAHDALGDAAYHRAYSFGAGLDADVAIAGALGERPFPPSARDPRGVLTERELEVAHLVAQGLTNKQIAGALVIATRTVEGHTERIRAKLGVTSRTQIAVWAVEQAGERGDSAGDRPAGRIES